MITVVSKSFNEESDELFIKAKLLIELRDYEVENIEQGEEETLIKATKQNTNEKVLIRIINSSKLKSDGVSVNKAEKILKEQGTDTVIVFGKRFTEASGRCLKEHDVEYFSQKRRVVSTLNSLELNEKITQCVDALCQITCGQVPESKSDCKGYSEDPTECTFCGGSGTLKEPFMGQKCSICGGVGTKGQHYPCKIRLISDNADFHLENSWVVLLQNDLLTLLEMLRVLKSEKEEDIQLPISA